MRVYQVPYSLTNLCTLKSGQTPSVDQLKQTIDWKSPADFGADTFPDRFITQAIATLTVETAGTYQFELRSDDGSRMSIDDQVVLDHDGLHGDEPKTASKALTAGAHSLLVEHFEAGGGERLTLSWKKPGDTAFSVVPSSVLSTPDKVTRVVAPGNKECEGAQDSPGDGLQLDGVNPAYEVTNLRPDGFQPKVTGMAWDGDDLILTTWGGTGDPVNQTSEGKLYRLTGVKTATGPSGVTVKELAGKLREPQGVAVVDVDGNGRPEYYVAEKDQISTFVDENTDGTFDGPKATFWKVPTSGNFHEFAFGLLYKDGKFHLNLSVAIDYGGATTTPQPAPLVDGKQLRGDSITVDAKTKEMKIVAGGLRTPNGIGFGPEGGTFVTDNQGGWLPANKLVQIKQDRFFNHMTTPAGPFQSNPVSKPVLWLPQNEIANSPSTPVLIPEGQPFAGQMMIGDVTYGGLQRAFLEKVDGEYQGAVFRGTQGLEAGVNEVLLGDGGMLITGGIGGGGNWEQAGKLTYGLQKLTPTGVAPFEMKSVEVVPGGFRVTYTEPVSAATLASLATKYTVKQWGYRPTAQYGGPKVDEQTLTVTSATASADGRSVTLAIDGLRPDRVVHIRSPRPFTSADGDSLYSTEAWYTLNSYPGYVAPPAAKGVYEQEDQQLLGTANVQTEHEGFSGGGYVGGFEKAGAGVVSAVTTDAAGTYDLSLRYANGPNPFQGPKTVSLVVNDVKQQITLPSTGTWKTYGTFRTTVELKAGANTVALRYDEGDQGNVNLDRMDVTPQGGTRYELEEGTLAGGAKVDTEHAGFSGTGFVAGIEKAGASTTVSVNATVAGDHAVTLRYANGPNPQPDQTKRMTLEVNGTARTIQLPPTGSWKTWGTWTGTVPLKVGANAVTLRYGTSDDGNVNLDALDVKAPAPVACTPVASPNDTFDGTALDTCRWTNVLNEDASGYRVSGGKLEIDAKSGDLSGAQTDAKNLVLQPVVGGDTSTWMTETTLSVDGSDDYLQAGLLVWGDNGNYGKVVVMRHPQNGWVTELGRVTNGNLAYQNAKLVDGQQQAITLRMWSDGELLRGAYSVDDGTTWVPIGDGLGVAGLSNPLVGLAAYNGTGKERASFDSFTLSEPPATPDPLASCQPVTPEAGYKALFDGTRASLANWTHAGGGRFAGQADCSIKSVGDFGLMVHNDPIDYAYSLKLDWMKPGDDNSGIFVGFPDPKGSSQTPIDLGHEIQIDSTDADSKTTGAIYNFQSADLAARDAALKPDGEWNAYEIRVEGNRIRVYLNGTLVNDFTNTDPKRMTEPSYIGLQTHGSGDDVFFRNVRIKNLDAPVETPGETPPTTQPVTPVVPPVTTTPPLAQPVLGSTKVDAVKKRRAAKMEVVCPPGGAACTGTVALKVGGKVVGTGSFSVAAGDSAMVKVKLKKRARTLLAKKPRVKGSLVITLADGSTTTTKVRLTR
nr:family 16 glycoside hydrolase [Nocardioides flavescens]